MRKFIHRIYILTIVISILIILGISITNHSTKYMLVSIVFLITLVVLLLLYFVHKFVKDNIITPIDEISTEIAKIKDRNTKTEFKTYKVERLNKLCKELSMVEDDVEKVVNNLDLERNKINYILDNMKDGFIIFDKYKKVFTINKKARQILDCYKKELGKDIIYYTQNIKFLENIDEVLRTKTNVTFDIKTDNKKVYSVHINPIKAGLFNSKKSGGIILIIDVTLDKKTEKIRQEFFSNASHELKTPITSIQGYTELLYNDFAKDKEQEKEFLEKIQFEINNITSLVNDILLIAKLETKEKDTPKLDTNINLVDLTNEIIETTKPACIENNILVENNCELVHIKADYKKIHELVSNLVTNAIKYNRQDGIVKVSCSDDDKFIYIVVEDTGIGIPKVDTERIFERFYRVEKGRSKSLGGTGLGLSIVKHIVKYYNGTIKVRSIEGEGSEFKIKLPKIL